jgi:hypothetical protein
VVALYRAIRVVCLHDVSMIVIGVEGADQGEEEPSHHHVAPGMSLPYKPSHLLLISVLSSCLNLNANTLATCSKVATKSFLVVRSDDDDKVLVAKLSLDLLNEVEDSGDECSFETIVKAANLMQFGKLANNVESILVAIVALFSLWYQVNQVDSNALEWPGSDCIWYAP